MITFALSSSPSWSDSARATAVRKRRLTETGPRPERNNGLVSPPTRRRPDKGGRIKGFLENERQGHVQREVDKTSSAKDAIAFKMIGKKTEEKESFLENQNL